jgi:hypothetical protein
MSADATPTPGPDTAATAANQWRLRYVVGDLTHYTEWTSEFATVENLYAQYRRGDYAHDVVLERRAEVRG